ncbi:MAG: hypothetical protein KF904_20280 [Rhodoblastus sp.]|nr:hypothetical protein [Rhodoblastus sp.]MCC0004658.1 hypothetical protein [Methylobacteriaceae bacterium]
MDNFALSREWPRRRVESYVAAAADLTEIVSSLVADRDEWLAARGLTIDQVRALPRHDQDNLEAEWASRSRI